MTPLCTLAPLHSTWPDQHQCRSNTPCRHHTHPIPATRCRMTHPADVHTANCCLPHTAATMSVHPGQTNHPANHYLCQLPDTDLSCASLPLLTAAAACAAARSAQPAASAPPAAGQQPAQSPADQLSTAPLPNCRLPQMQQHRVAPGSAVASQQHQSQHPALTAAAAAAASAAAAAPLQTRSQCCCCCCHSLQSRCCCCCCR